MDAMSRLDYDELNSTIRYLCSRCSRCGPAKLPRNRAKVRDDAASSSTLLRTRASWFVLLCDVSGLRADADFMIWCMPQHRSPAGRVRAVPARGATRQGRRRGGTTWPCTGPRNSTAPGQRFAGEAPGKYICVYPFVRSYEWYLLPDEERRKMLKDRSMAAAAADVRANTVPAYALERLRVMAARVRLPEMIRIVDLMRDLRATEARMHVREETPFFSGPRVPRSPHSSMPCRRPAVRYVQLPARRRAAVRLRGLFRRRLIELMQ